MITKLALSCQLTGIVNGPPKQIKITMQAVSPGLKTIQLTSSTNATVDVPSFVTGTTSPVIVTATKINQSPGSPDISIYHKQRVWGDGQLRSGRLYGHDREGSGDSYLPETEQR